MKAGFLCAWPCWTSTTSNASTTIWATSGGDEVLRTFARIAQQGVRGGDVFGRYGGEEFLLIFPATSLLPSLNTCERIRAQVEPHAWTGCSRAA